MSKQGPLEQLVAVYDAKSDEELLALQAQLDDLTDTAQEALTQVLASRHLSVGRPAVQAEAPSADGDEAEESLAAGERLVYLFNDAFEAREAMRHLSEAEIPFRMLDWHKVEPERPVSYSGVDLGLVVAGGDVEGATKVLAEKLGLFPAAEMAGDAESEAWGSLPLLERDQALQVARALGEAGFSYLWRDGRDDHAQLPDEETIALEVRPERMDEAMTIVHATLG